MELLVGAPLEAASSAMRMVSTTSRVCGLSSWGKKGGQQREESHGCRVKPHNGAGWPQ